jgi:ATP-dependent Clp protease ATP-binding subunit ClpA
MAVSLDALIADVEQRTPTSEPLALLATASATANDLSEATDALLSHFVDRSRRAGHSWSEIGEALGVTKQAVQKRFTGEKQWLRGAQLLTDRARVTLTDHAEKAATELGTKRVGTGALLLGIWGEPKGLAAKALKGAGVTRAKTLAAVVRVLPKESVGAYTGGYTPHAWSAMENLITIAAAMGHNYIGTEHVLIALLSAPEASVASQALDALGVRAEAITDFVHKVLNGIST